MSSEFETISGAKLDPGLVQSTHHIEIITKKPSLSVNEQAEFMKYVKLIPKQFPSLSISSVSISNNKVNFNIGSLLDQLSDPDIQNKLDKFTKFYNSPVDISKISVTQEAKVEVNKIISDILDVKFPKGKEEENNTFNFLYDLKQEGKELEDKAKKEFINKNISIIHSPKSAKDINFLKSSKVNEFIQEFIKFNFNKERTGVNTLDELFDRKEQNIILDVLRGKDLQIAYDQEESQMLSLQLLTKLQWIQLSLIKALSGKIQR